MFVCSLLLGLALVLASYVPARAVQFEWSGLPIVGEDPSFIPTGNAQFDIISGTTLRLTLTNTSPLILSIGQALSGLTWDITPLVSLTPVSALIASGSLLVGVGSTSDTDLSGEWAFQDDILAGGGLGSFGIGAMGDINFGADSFGPGDRFNDTASLNLFGPPSGSLNGIGGAIVGPSVDLFSDGFTSQGPLVQGFDGTNTTPGQMVFNWGITGAFPLADITNVQPLFGTDGAPAVPEPSTILLLGSGLAVLGFLRWRRKAA